MKKTFQQKIKIIANNKLGKDFFCLTLECSQVALSAKPGQFVQVKIGSSPVDPILRRPFGVHRVKGDNFDILCQVVGKGTQLLSQKKPGEFLDVIGPLGKGFEYQSSVVRRPSSVLVAGGMGVAPLLFLAEKLKKVTKSPSHQVTSTVLIGAKTKSQILCANEFRKLGCRVQIASDDGSLGFKGYVSELLESLLSTIDYRLSTIYACGPRPMLQEITRISEEYSIPAQISLEEHLACGIGACLGCVVRVKGQGSRAKENFEYKRVCKDGPVFNAKEIIW